MTQWEWKLLEELEAARRPEAEAAVRDLVATHPHGTLDHDPEWLAMMAGSPDRSARHYVCHDAGGVLVGYAPFFLHPSSFTFEYGGYSLFDFKIFRYSITAQPLIALATEPAVSAAISLATRLRRDLHGRDVVFLLGLHLDSAMASAIGTPESARQFEILPRGQAYQRRLARVEATLDDYLGKLGSKTRQDLRRQERRLLKEADGAVAVSVHATPDSVAEFLAAVETVSRRTYQWNLHGMGIKNDEGRRDFLRWAAARGWFRGYVMRCGDVPVAFMLGYLYRGVYQSTAIGFDPGWGEWSVGNVLHLHVMRDLSSLGGVAPWFDFMYGDSSNKERLSTHSHAERNYYLIPRMPRWRLFVAALRAFDACADAMNRVLDRFGLRNRARRAIRLRSTATARGETGES